MGTNDFYNTLWRLGARILHASKKIGVPGLEYTLGELARRYIPPPREETIVQITAGAILIIPPGFGPARTYALGLHEQEVTAAIQARISPGMGVIDIGAFCGYYTLLASRLAGPEGCVYSFEPHPGNFSYLERNISVNSCRNVVLANVAVGAETRPGTLVLSDDADHHWLSTALDDMGIPVPTVSLDDFFSPRGWPPVHLIKVDAEGSEVGVLRGMRELSRRNPGVSVILEHDPRNLRRAGETDEALASILIDLGFISGYILERAKAFSLEDSLPSLGRATYNLLFTKQSPPMDMNGN